MRRELIAFSHREQGASNAVIYEEIAQDWFDGLRICAGASFSVATFSMEEVRANFDVWTVQFFRALKNNPFNPHALRAIGTELAVFYQARPEVLGITLRVLSDAVAMVMTSRTPTTLHRLAVVIGELATGFTAATCDVILSQQEQTQCVYLTRQPDTAEVAEGSHGGSACAPSCALSIQGGRGEVSRRHAKNVSGQLTRDETGERLCRAADDVSRGEDGWIFCGPTAGVDRQRQSSASPTALSTRELDVLQLVARGCTNQEIATTLYVAEGTVKNHITHIYTKLAVRSRAEAVAWAWQQGLGN